MPEDTLAPTPQPPQPEHTPPPKAKGAHSPLLRVVIWLAILLAFGLIFWAVIRHKDIPASRGGRRAMGGAVTLTTATAYKGSIGVYLQAIGTVTPVHTDTITSQASGLVTAVDYREGQIVTRGQRLVQIDPRPYQAQVLSAQGALERDTGLLAQGRMDLDRYRTAWARNAVAKQILDDQEKLVMQQEGTVKSDQGALQLDQVNLSYCDVIAPISGRVGLRLVDPGNVVNSTSATPLVVITQLQPTTVVFTVAEDSLGAVEEQLRHSRTLSVDAFDRTDQAKLSSGKLLTTDNLIDTTTGTLKMRAIFDNKNNALFPNLFVNTRLLVNTLQDVTLLASSAIQHNGDTAFVFLIRDGVAHIQDVKEGVTDSGISQVEGVQPGDVVANSGFEKLIEGSKVTIAKKALPPSTTTETNAP